MTSSLLPNNPETASLIVDLLTLAATIFFTSQLVRNDNERRKQAEIEKVDREKDRIIGYCKNVFLKNKDATPGQMQVLGHNLAKKFPNNINYIIQAYEDYENGVETITALDLLKFINYMDNYEGKDNWQKAYNQRKEPLNMIQNVNTNLKPNEMLLTTFIDQWHKISTIFISILIISCYLFTAGFLDGLHIQESPTLFQSLNFVFQSFASRFVNFDFKFYTLLIVIPLLIILIIDYYYKNEPKRRNSFYLLYEKYKFYFIFLPSVLLLAIDFGDILTIIYGPAVVMFFIYLANRAFPLASKDKAYLIVMGFSYLITVSIIFFKIYQTGTEFTLRETAVNKYPKIIFVIGSAEKNGYLLWNSDNSTYGLFCHSSNAIIERISDGSIHSYITVNADYFNYFCPHPGE